MSGSYEYDPFDWTAGGDDVPPDESPQLHSMESQTMACDPAIVIGEGITADGMQTSGAWIQMDTEHTISTEEWQ